MKYIKVLLICILLSSTLFGCINRPSSNVGYSIYLTPDEDSEITLLIPVVTDKKYGGIDEVMLIDPKFPKGSALFEIVETEKGSALKITTNEEVQIRFLKYYDDETRFELMENKTLSMTNITYDKTGKSIMKSWIFFNSTTNHTESYRSTLMAGDKNEILILEIGDRNISNGWHQFTVKEGYGIS